MVRFACPTCQTQFDVADGRQGEKFSCNGCGQRLQIPAPSSQKTVLGSIIEPVVGPASLAPTTDAVPEVQPVSPATTVRLFGQGLQANRFKTKRAPRKILEAVDEMLYSLGVDFDKGGSCLRRLATSPIMGLHNYIRWNSTEA